METALSRLSLILLLTVSVASAQKSVRIHTAQKSSDSAYSFAAADRVIQQAVRGHDIPGAVLLIGHDGKVIFEKSYGDRSLEPIIAPMTEDTIFDVASLTKVVATTPCVMRLLEQGQIRLSDSVAKYIPEFNKNGKQDITIRMLLTHHSGLREDLDLKQPWRGHDTAFQMAMDETPINPPGSRFLYSDINFEVLGFLVERLSGMPLNEYAAKYVFAPLKMDHTRFLPPENLLKKIAPTEFDKETQKILHGIVHDPTARRMGGVAGHAGLFSTAEDLAIYAQSLLDRNNNPVLDARSIEKMSTPQQPPTSTNLRGLGWDLDTSFSSNRGELLGVGSFGHTGFTGTSLWIDPYTNTYIILLTNAVHPQQVPGGGKVALRTLVTNAIVAAMHLPLPDDALAKQYTLTGYNEAAAGVRRPVNRNGKVLNGIDMLESSDFAELRGKRKTTRVGLLTNQTGYDLQGRRTIDILAHAPGIELKALFSPEHGAAGKLDTTDIGNAKDEVTGVSIYSVYGATDAARHPDPKVVKDLDALVVDIQDVGARFYTYETSMGYFLEAAAQANVEVFVLDRPNPITGTFVQGPISDGSSSFVNYHPVPVRHGMTMGELAQLFNKERNINAKLTVVKMQGWVRGDWFDAANQLWINPSPNMRSLTEATLYTGVALIEGTNVSVGRGTDTPFELVGAPWINASELAAYLNSRNISGVRFVPVKFTPASAVYPNQECSGVNIFVTDRIALDAPELGIELASALIKLYPQQYKAEKIVHLLGGQSVYDALTSGQDPRRIADYLPRSFRDVLSVSGCQARPPQRIA